VRVPRGVVAGLLACVACVWRHVAAPAGGPERIVLSIVATSMHRDNLAAPPSPARPPPPPAHIPLFHSNRLLHQAQLSSHVVPGHSFRFPQPKAIFSLPADGEHTAA
jgi:hypothetical protein